MYVLKLLHHSTTRTVSNEYNTALSLFFVVFFFSCLLVSWERNHSTWGRKGGEKKKGGREGRGGRVADSVWYVSPVIGSVSSVCGLCCCQEATGEVERGRVDVGTACRVKGWGVGRVKRSRVSPGSLCRSLVPAVHSCSSSSLSAGCTAARWCLWRREKESHLSISFVSRSESVIYVLH